MMCVDLAGRLYLTELVYRHILVGSKQQCVSKLDRARKA